MLPPFIRGIRTALAVNSKVEVSLLREPTVGPVIPDVLVAIWESPPAPVLRKRLSYLECHVLALVEIEDGATCDEIGDHLYLLPATTERVVSSLLKKGAIQRDGPRFGLAPTSRTDEVEIVAVEAKLWRWQEALNQAVTYKAFANRVYVLLDANRVNLTPEITRLFGDASVGLLLQWGHVVSHVVSAPRERTIGPMRVLAASKLARGETA